MMIGTLSAVLLVSALGLPGYETSPSPAEQYRCLIREIDAARNAYIAEARSDHPDPARLEGLFKARDSRRFVDRFRELARRAPTDPAAVDALIWISDHGNGRASDEARSTLAREYLDSERILPVFRCLEHESGSHEAEGLLRLAASGSTHRDVRGRASYWLARYLVEQEWYIRALQMPPGYWAGHTDVDIEPPKHIEQTYGKEALERLSRSDPAKVRAEAVELYRRVLTTYPDTENDSRNGGHPKTLGEAAHNELGALENLAIGLTAPEILGEDVDGRPFRLGDFRGKVVLLDFGSQTYCGVCRDLVSQWHTLTKRLEGKPFALIGINADPDRAKLRNSIEASRATWRTVWDGDLGGPIFSAWDIRIWPTVYVIDRQGVIRYKNLFGKELDHAVDALLGEEPQRVGTVPD